MPKSKRQRKRSRARPEGGRPEKPLKIDDSPLNVARALFGIPSDKFKNGRAAPPDPDSDDDAGGARFQPS